MITFDYKKRAASPPSEILPASALCYPPDASLRGESVFYSADKEPLQLEGTYRGGTLFLLCSGPSLRNLDLSLLNRRGIVTMAVNNAWLLHRPQMWVGVDNPSQFSDTGWKDPGILKFTPGAHLGRPLCTFDGKAIIQTKQTPRQCPGVVAFRRHDGYDPATFLEMPVCGWGTSKEVPCALGIRNSRSVMSAAIWVAYKLGFRTINLLGCDFNMPESGPCYAFEQDKHAQGRVSNNRLYRVLNRRLRALVPHLLARRVSVWNANPASGLTCFQHRPYEEMLERAHTYCRTDVPHGGWYK